MQKYGLPWGLSGKESACNIGGMGLTSGSGRSTGGGNGNPSQDSCLGNPTEKGAWWATVYGVARVRDDRVTELPPSCMHVIHS